MTGLFFPEVDLDNSSTVYTLTTEIFIQIFYNLALTEYYDEMMASFVSKMYVLEIIAISKPWRENSLEATAVHDTITYLNCTTTLY